MNPSHTDRARVLLELVEDCLKNDRRDVAVEAIANGLRCAELDTIERQRAAEREHVKRWRAARHAAQKRAAET